MASHDKKVLLSSIFTPCGVDDAYGRKENIPELLHNQLTQFQGVFSIRHQFPSIGLHLMGANLDSGATVLDFPSEERFIEELKKGYDLVGVGGIQPNFLKIKRMCELVRRHAPSAELVVGGFAAMLEDADRLFEADHLCRGEGIRFMRDLLGEPAEFEMRHPFQTLDIIEYMGVPVRPLYPLLTRVLGLDPSLFRSHFIATGLGCTNTCEFCSTSFFFHCKHLPFMRTGREIYEVMDRKARATGIGAFAFIGDDNFFLDRSRVEELWKLQRDNQQDYKIMLSFGSTDLLSEYDPEMLAEAGFDLIWIGIESELHPFAKNRKADPREVIAGLHKWGIKTILSSILFMDVHTKENIHRDIDYHLSLFPAYSQFSILAPAEGTPLEGRLREAGRMLHSIPMEERHAFKQMWFIHPEFSLTESEKFQRDAYERDFIELGPSLLRYQLVTARSVEAYRESKSPVLQARARALEKEASSWKSTMLAAGRLVQNPSQERIIRGYLAEVEDRFGRVSMTERAKAGIIFSMARAREIRTAVLGDVIQPVCTLTRYGNGRAMRYLYP